MIETTLACLILHHFVPLKRVGSTKNYQLLSQSRICGHRRTPNGEHVCLRYFCVFCLRLTHDANIKEIRSKSDWICPTCTGTCCCTRCIRNELITKLALTFVHSDGDLRLLREQTPIASIMSQLSGSITIEAVYLKGSQQRLQHLTRTGKDKSGTKDKKSAGWRQESEKAFVQKKMLQKTRSRLEQEMVRLQKLKEREETNIQLFRNRAQTLAEIRKHRSIKLDSLLFRKNSHFSSS